MEEVLLSRMRKVSKAAVPERRQSRESLCCVCVYMYICVSIREKEAKRIMMIIMIHDCSCTGFYLCGSLYKGDTTHERKSFLSRLPRS